MRCDPCLLDCIVAYGSASGERPYSVTPLSSRSEISSRGACLLPSLLIYFVSSFDVDTYPISFHTHVQHAPKMDS